MSNEIPNLRRAGSALCRNARTPAMPSVESRGSPWIAPGVVALVICLAACSPTPTSQSHWTTKGGASSPFSATLYEDTYNSGDSTLYSLRFEKREERFGGGWFVKKSLDGDQPHPRRPALVWSTQKDLRVVVYTEHIQGRTVQTFTNNARTDGSLTLDYQPAP